jgi:hypothetical protein
MSTTCVKKRWAARLAGWSAALVAAVATAGCGGDDGDSPSATGGSVGEDGPAYAISAKIRTPESSLSYLSVAPGLDAETQVETRKGLEVQTSFPHVHGGALYVPGGYGSPTITRYTLDGGKLTRGETLSFAALGLRGVDGYNITIVSDTKAYVFDAPGLRAIAWDPSAMTLPGVEIDLSGLEREGYSAEVIGAPFAARRRGDRLLLPVGWWDQDYAPLEAAGLLVIDTASDEVVTIDEDDRCAGAFTSVELASGDIYFFQSWLATMTLHTASTPKPSCALRIRAGAEEIDADGYLDLSALAGGRAANGGIPDGGEGFYFMAFHEERVTSTDPTELQNASLESNWHYWHFDPEAGEAREVTTLPWIVAGEWYFQLEDGRVFHPANVQDKATGASTTTLMEMTGGSDPVPTISVEGMVELMARMR